jgi:hypothetical protein
MSESVQGWSQKWFYIKDQKTSATNEYELAPFDANKGLTKLTFWDALPSDAEVKEIKPLLARIQEPKTAAGKELSGTQLMVFFLQHRIQPLQRRIQARVSKLWTYSGSSDPSQVSPKNPEIIEKRVRSLSTLTAKLAIPACLAVPFDSAHPLPKVLSLRTRSFSFLRSSPLIFSTSRSMNYSVLSGSSFPFFLSSSS